LEGNGVKGRRPNTFNAKAQRKARESAKKNESNSDQ
jgi:hypothetical protein